MVTTKSVGRAVLQKVVGPISMIKLSTSPGSPVTTLVDKSMGHSSMAESYVASLSNIVLGAVDGTIDGASEGTRDGASEGMSEAPVAPTIANKARE